MKQKKFDETKYIMNGTLKGENSTYGNKNYRKSPGQHVTLLSSASLSPNANASTGSGSSGSATIGLLNGTTTTSSRLLKYSTNSLRKAGSVISSDSSSSPNNHEGSFNYAYIKAPTKEFYA